MAPRRPRLTVQVQTRREFLERSLGAVAAAGLAACYANRDWPGDGAVPGARRERSTDGRERRFPQDAGSKRAAACNGLRPITPNEHFYITSCCSNPQSMSPLGALNPKPRRRNRQHRLRHADASPCPQQRAHPGVHQCCPYYLAISNALWTGLPLTEVFSATGFRSRRHLELVFRSVDQYYTSIPVRICKTRMARLAYERRGVADRARLSGATTRAWALRHEEPKWITSIDFVDQPLLATGPNGLVQGCGLPNQRLGSRSFRRRPAGELVANGTHSPQRSDRFRRSLGGWR